jgi:hypothetical protein
VRDAKEAKLLKESKDREKAVQAALELQEKRKKERAEREQVEAAAKDKREKDRQARDKAGRDADKLEAQVRRIQKEIDTQKRKLDETKGERPKILEEEKFILEYVSKAQANVANLRTVLDKIAAADKAAEEAARAAAAAAAAAAKK